MQSIPDHIEKYLGKINRGWSVPDESSFRYSVLEFQNWAEGNIRTYSTLGVSDHCLSLTENRSVRQEFLMCFESSVDAGDVSGFILRFGDMVLQKHRAILRGEVIGPGRPLFSGTKMSALYCTNPAIYPEGLRVYSGVEPNVVFVWLLPIYTREVDYIRFKGSEEFESLLAEKDPDFWDIKRELLV